MSRILVLYASFDGQTARIAERIAAGLAKAGHAVTVRSADAPEAARDIEECDALVVGGSIRYGRFASSLVERVRDRAPAIDERPNAFFSVSLSALRDDAAARACMKEFAQRTGWNADQLVAFAGALRYLEYTPFIRFMMRLIAYANGESTDTSRDHEYTDWQAVDRFATTFAAKVAARATA